MKELTLEQVRDQGRRAREAFLAAGGKLPEKTITPFSQLSCFDLAGASASCWLMAAQAELSGAGSEYVAYYSGLATAFDAVADAQGC